MKRSALIVGSLALVACGAQEPPGSPSPSTPSGGALATLVGALDAAPRTIPYSGYVDFDGQPVNAGSVKFNFAIFPCATPGPGQCDEIWVAKGTWTNTADWSQGWPATTDYLSVPVFGGRFSVDLGAAGQNPLPAVIFDGSVEALYLATRIEGRSLGALQKVAPTPRTHVAALAHVAESAEHFTVRGDLAANGKVEVGMDLAVNGSTTLTGDATFQGAAQVLGDLDVAGALRFGGRTFGRVTACKYASTTQLPPSSNGSRFYYYWVEGDCDNGLPAGTCLGFISKASQCGTDEDWEVVSPGEDPTVAGGPATHGGMAWWSGSPCLGLNIAATYLCEE